MPASDAIDDDLGRKRASEDETMGTTDQRCICAAILAADSTRHFKECPLRAEHPDVVTNHAPRCARQHDPTTFVCEDCGLTFATCLRGSLKWPGKCDRCSQAAALFETVRGLRADKNEHPWAAFLLARRHALVWLRDEMGETPEKTARTMSMNTLQVRLILAYDAECAEASLDPSRAAPSEAMRIVEHVPGKCGERAVLTGTRMPVWCLARLTLKQARTMYPHLTDEQIVAAHSYAKNHPDEIAKDILENDEANDDG